MPGVRLKPSSVEPPVAPGARYEWHGEACPSGTRRYRLYTPAALAGDTSGAPLVVMLHGCTQGPDDFALGTKMNLLAERHGVLVAYPEQTRGQNPMACWNWFQPANQAGGSGEPAILAAIAGGLVARHGLDGSRVFVAGLSAGGAMAATLGAVRPDVFAAVGVHSGLPHGCAGDVSAAQRAMATGGRATAADGRDMTSGGQGGATGGPGRGPGSGVRAFVVHGSADRTVHPANGDAVFADASRGLALETRRDGRSRVTTARDRTGRVQAEHRLVQGLGHAWAGGDAAGSHTDAAAPDASEAMLRFFLDE